MDRNVMVKCDKCGRMFSFGMARRETVEAGEYQAQYFSCPLCGEKYHITTTDKTQREQINELNRMIRRRMLGVKKKLKLKTLKRMHRQEKKQKNRIKQRAKWLGEIGRALVQGKTLEEATARGEAFRDGEATGGSAAGSVSDLKKRDQGSEPDSTTGVSDSGCGIGGVSGGDEAGIVPAELHSENSDSAALS